jgi:hypothetical protein
VIPVRVRQSDLDRIDAALGQKTRSEWARAAMLAALEPPARQKKARSAPIAAPGPATPGECKHPGVRYKQRCPKCGGYNMKRGGE